jgi:hypothetical protein
MFATSHCIAKMRAHDTSYPSGGHRVVAAAGIIATRLPRRAQMDRQWRGVRRAIAAAIVAVAPNTAPNAG